MKSIAAACMLNIQNCAETRRISTIRRPILMAVACLNEDDIKKPRMANVT